MKLKQVYADVFERGLQTKDITFFLRDYKRYIHSYTKDADIREKMYKIFEKEILSIIVKEKNNLDWFNLDIDRKIPLTYAIFNQAYNISDYLISNIYDLTQYNSYISSSLTASIRLDNIEYFQKIIKNSELHPDYVSDLTIHSIHAAAMNPAELACYYEKISEKNHSYDFHQKILENLTQPPFKALRWFLYHNKLDNKDIINIVDDILNKNNLMDRKNMSDSQSKNLNEIYQRWKLKKILEIDLPVNQKQKTRKI